MSKVNVEIVTHMTRVSSLHKRLMLPEEWKALMPTATTRQFLRWCDRESINAGKACVVAMTLLDLLLRKLMETGTDDQIKEFDVQKCMSAALSYCRLVTLGPSASYLHGVHLEIADVMPPGCAPIDDQTSAYLRNHITRNVMLLYSRDAIWKHVEKCLRAVFVDSRIQDREGVLRHIQCGTSLGEGVPVDMIKWLDTAGVIDQLKELHKYERTNAEEESEEEWDEDNEEDTAAAKKKRGLKGCNGEEDALLTGLVMVNHLVIQSSRVRTKLLNAMTSEIRASDASDTDSKPSTPLLKRWKRFSFVPVMKASRTFVTIDKMTIRSFLKTCAKADKLQILRASTDESQARLLDAKEKRLNKQRQKQRQEREKARRKERAEWIKRRMEQTRGKKRTRVGKKTKAEWEAEFDKQHPAIELERRRTATGGGKWIAPDFFDEACVTKTLKRTQWNAFLNSVDLCHILRVRKRERKGGAQCMATFKTNGIEAHVPFVVGRIKEIEWDETKGPVPKKLKSKGYSGDFPSKNSATFPLLQHGAWKVEALSKEHFDAANISWIQESRIFSRVRRVMSKLGRRHAGHSCILVP